MTQTCTLSRRYNNLPPKRRYVQPIPFGWFFVSYSDELVVGDVRTIACFGQEWVLFRNERGEVGMLEPYCPHLGAHIGIGGKVDGNLVRCPFHAWGFDAAGYCRDVPYAKKMPPILERRAALKALPVVESSKIIWAWYHPKGIAPMWEVDVLSDAAFTDWIDYEKFEFEIDTSVQDISENSIDYPHLKYVHGHTTVLTGKASHDGVYRHINIDGDMQVLDPNGKSVPCHYSINLTQKGPGQKIIRYQRVIELSMMFLMTPITSEKTILRFAFTHKKYPENSYEYKAVKDLMLEKIGTHGGMTGVYADIPIWNNKIYRERPLLCDGDGPIMKFRRWFKQFYINSRTSEKI